MTTRSQSRRYSEAFEGGNPPSSCGLRSDRWFTGHGETAVRHRSVLATLGFDTEHIAGKPIIGICNPASELNNCEMGLHELVPLVKRGVTAAGGIPLEFATMPLGAELLKPSDLLYRNLVSMDIEETVRGYPIDGVVMLTTCDKTTPAQLMAAASCNIPTTQLTGGPKSVGYFRGRSLSSGTDFWKYLEAYRAGELSDEEWKQLEKCLSCSYGGCNEMGTSSTMSAMSEALGIMPSGTSSIPANDSRRRVACEAAGRRIVGMVHEGLSARRIMTREAFENAIRVLNAIAGSTNAIIHLIAIAGRCGISLPLDLFDRISAATPVLVDLKPSGKYLVEDFHRAGGLPVVMKELGDQLHVDCITGSGRTIGDHAATAICHDPAVIRSGSEPLLESGALVVLRGNLAPGGAVLKAAAATETLLQHEGPALVFESYEEMLEGIDNEDLDVVADTVLLMRNTGPRGVPGMPEWGEIPIPRKLLRQGVMDMVRISDARMSGTSYGTVILHASPESAVGGPLAVVRNGDRIRLDVRQRKLELLVDDEEIQTRLLSWSAPRPRHQRGYLRMFADHVLQAEEGCDLDFLRPSDEESLTFVEPTVGRT